jgi:hypothetical protein
LAAGSYNRTTALYSENNCELLFVLHGQEGGVTQVRLSLAFFLLSLAGIEMQPNCQLKHDFYM